MFSALLSHFLTLQVPSDLYLSQLALKPVHVKVWHSHAAQQVDPDQACNGPVGFLCEHQMHVCLAIRTLAFSAS